MSSDSAKNDYLRKIDLIARRKENKSENELLFMFADIFNFYFCVSVRSLFSVYVDRIADDNETNVTVKFRIPHEDIICLTGLSKKEIGDIMAKINLQKEQVPFYSNVERRWRAIVNDKCSALTISYFRCKLCEFESIDDVSEYAHFGDEHKSIFDNVIHMKKGPKRYLTKDNECVICGMRFMFAEGGKYKDYNAVMTHLLSVHSNGEDFDRLREFVKNKMSEW